LYSLQVLVFQVANIAMHQSTVVTAMATLLLRLLPAGSIAVACYVWLVHSPLMHYA